MRLSVAWLPLYWAVSGLAVCGLMVSSAASAHNASPFLLPDHFDLDSDSVTLQSAITVEKFFIPSRAFDSRFDIVAPDGQRSTLPAAVKFQRFSMVEIATPQQGTYQVTATSSTASSSTGNGVNASSGNDYALIDGRWLRIRPAKKAPDAGKAVPTEGLKSGVTSATSAKTSDTPKTNPDKPNPDKPRAIALADVPADAQRHRTNITQVAQTYVSKGAPSALNNTMPTGLWLKPLKHPNDLFAGDTLDVVALQDGKPLANLEIDVFLGAGPLQRDAKREQPSVSTDANGKASIRVEQAGVYLLATQYPPANADLSVKPPAQVTQYGLTLEVAP